MAWCLVSLPFGGFVVRCEVWLVVAYDGFVIVWMVGFGVSVVGSGLLLR